MTGFGVERLIEPLALDKMRGALGRRQFGAAQVLIDLEQFGFIVAQIVVDLGADDLMPALARRFEPVKAGHQFVTGAAPPNRDRLQHASRRNGFDEPVHDLGPELAQALRWHGDGVDVDAANRARAPGRGRTVRYCSSLTFSSQSTFFPLSVS